MASDHGNGPPEEHGQGDLPPPAETNDRPWQNGGRQTPDSFHRLRPTNSNHSSHGGSLPPAAAWPDEPRKSGERNRSKQRSGRSASGQVRICKKCGEQLTGQFVRALDGTFHLDCFKCRVSLQCLKRATNNGLPLTGWLAANVLW